MLDLMRVVEIKYRHRQLDLKFSASDSGQSLSCLRFSHAPDGLAYSVAIAISRILAKVDLQAHLQCCHPPLPGRSKGILLGIVCVSS